MTEESELSGEEHEEPSIFDVMAEHPLPVRNPTRDVGRDDPCPRGSGKKFTKCCDA